MNFVKREKLMRDGALYKYPFFFFFFFLLLLLLIIIKSKLAPRIVKPQRSAGFNSGRHWLLPHFFKGGNNRRDQSPSILKQTDFGRDSTSVGP